MVDPQFPPSPLRVDDPHPHQWILPGERKGRPDLGDSFQCGNLRVRGRPFQTASCGSLLIFPNRGDYVKLAFRIDTLEKALGEPNTFAARRRARKSSSKQPPSSRAVVSL